MTRKKRTNAPPLKRAIERYEHTDKSRSNKLQVGVTPDTEPLVTKHNMCDYGGGCAIGEQVPK